MIRNAYPALAGLAAALLAMPALAADLYPATDDQLYSPVPSQGWVITLGGKGVYSPAYLGADKYTFVPFPFLSIRRAGTPETFRAPDDGLSVALLDEGWVRAGAVARYRSGRYFSDDSRLFGLDKVPWTVEGGAFLEFWPTKNLRARLEVRHGFRDDDGWVGDLGADFVAPFGGFTFSAGPRFAFGSDKFMRTNFGVSPFEASLNPFVTPFKPDGGLYGLGAAAGLSYKWSPSWTATLDARYTRLVQDADKSPIVRNIGSPNQFLIGLSLAYSFVTH